MSRWFSSPDSPPSAPSSPETPRSELEPCLPPSLRRHGAGQRRRHSVSTAWHRRVPILRLLHRSLFWRIYLHALTLLVVVGLSVAMTWNLVGQRPQWANIPQRVALHIGQVWPESLSPGRETPSRSPLLERGATDEQLNPSAPAAAVQSPSAYTLSQLEQELRMMAQLTGVDLTLYTAGGELLMSSVQPPLPFLPVLPAETREGTLTHNAKGRMRVLPIYARGALVGQLLFAWPQALVDMVTRAIGVVFAVLLALALGSLPLARGMVAPLRRLAESARALGAGQLSTRTGLDRSDEVGEVAHAFDDMAERLERLILSEKELLANISHELRTPLARIRFALELAHDGNPEEAQRYLGEVATDVAELERLVEDVLTAARMDHAQARGQGIPLRRGPVSVNDWLEQTAQRFQTQHPERAFEVHALDEDVEVQGDAMLLRRVLDNLLENAYKYAEPTGAIELRAARQRPATPPAATPPAATPPAATPPAATPPAATPPAATPPAATHLEQALTDDRMPQEGVSLPESLPGIWLTVRDRGPGIAPEDLPRIFTPFFRAEKSRSRGSGGVGLGLTLVKRVVEAHHGRIEVESEQGQGTCFFVWIPIG